jgi:subtilisin family serine protease
MNMSAVLNSNESYTAASENTGVGPSGISARTASEVPDVHAAANNTANDGWYINGYRFTGKAYIPTAAFINNMAATAEKTLKMRLADDMQKPGFGAVANWAAFFQALETARSVFPRLDDKFMAGKIDRAILNLMEDLIGWTSCAAAKAALDYIERAKYLENRGQDSATDNKCQDLETRADDGFNEVLPIYAAVLDLPSLPKVDFAGVAKRVAEYNGKRITQSWAEQTKADGAAVERSNSATVLIAKAKFAV